MKTHDILKSSFSKLFIASLIVGLGACSSKKASDDQAMFDDATAEVAVDAGAASGADAAAISDADAVVDVIVADAGNDNDAATDEAPRASRSSRVRAYSGSEQVMVETTPFEKEGFLLNGIYFVRGSEESWSSLSQKLYGRPDRDQLIKQWNKGQPLNIGSAIYYNSPSRPEDRSAMKPFAMDFGSSLEKHVVQRGESLSQIAAQMYGDPMSWKEISALNPDIQNPDRIEIGQNIIVQPKGVDTQAFLANLANQADQNTASEGSAAPGTMGDQAAIQTPALPAEEVVTPPPVSEAQPEIVAKQEPKKANPFMAWFNLMKGDDDSSSLFLVGIVLILGALLFLVINNRRKAARRHQEDLDNLADFKQKTGSQD